MRHLLEAQQKTFNVSRYALLTSANQNAPTSDKTNQVSVIMTEVVYVGAVYVIFATNGLLKNRN